MSNLNFELVGVYGKRTKYQQKDLAQLLLKVNKPENNEQETNVRNEEEEQLPRWTHFNKELESNLLPKDLLLNDDTILDRVKISDPKDEQDLQQGAKNLTQIEQIVLYCALLVQVFRFLIFVLSIKFLKTFFCTKV